MKRNFTMTTTTRKHVWQRRAGTGLLLILLVAFFLITLSGCEKIPTLPEPDHWPTNGWQTTTPEEQGFDSVKLADGLIAIQKAGIPIHSLILARNGKMLLEAYFYPYDGAAPHSTSSVTKSITTTLIGIAIDQGKLSLDDRMISFFPEYSIAALDARKKAITIRHLASMSAGMECSGLPDELTVAQMEASPNWVQFALDRPMVYEPGKHWEYCGLWMHLLSAILEKATGMPAQEFARLNLFEPLGIQSGTWPMDPQGVNMGAGNLRLYPTDMAKLGLLWLQQGRWDGQQVVSSGWVRQSVVRRFQAGSDSYGYGWWISDGLTGPSYDAVGSGGQRITVDPTLNLIVVTTGGGFNFDDVVPYLVSAFMDLKNPLPANPTGDATLAEVLAELPQPPDPQPTPPLPAVVGEISGKVFHFNPNPFLLESLRLDFNTSAEATVQFGFTDGQQTTAALVGLDGVYRMTQGLNLDRAFHVFADFKNLTVGMRGAWVDKNTFRLEYDTLVNRYFYLLEMQFDGENISVKGSERGTSATASFAGKILTP
jgi:CubicO group peptidase (beta-lactamase class C family)